MYPEVNAFLLQCLHHLVALPRDGHPVGDLSAFPLRLGSRIIFVALKPTVLSAIPIILKLHILEELEQYLTLFVDLFFCLAVFMMSLAIDTTTAEHSDVAR